MRYQRSAAGRKRSLRVGDSSVWSCRPALSAEEELTHEEVRAAPYRKGEVMKTKAKACKLLLWSINKDGIQRPPVCPECGEPAEVCVDMIGRPCYGHKAPPAYPFTHNRKTGRK